MSETIAELCKQHRLTLIELADRSKLDLSRARAIYEGRWLPSPVEREGIAAALETTVDEIVWGHKTPIQHIYGHGPG